jgi:hypothetical protein
VLNEINSVIELVRARGDSLFADPTLFNYYERLDVGAHLMYDFIAAGAHVLHHGVYIGNKVVIEILNYRDRDNQIQSYQSITHIHDFVRRAIINSSPIVIRLYNNPFPPSVIAERAVWTLGKYPRYNLYNENCETVASWICMNDYTQSHLCITPKTVFRPFVRAAPVAVAPVAVAAAAEDDEEFLAALALSKELEPHAVAAEDEEDELLAALSLSNELDAPAAARVRSGSLDGGARRKHKTRSRKHKKRASRRNRH